MVKNRNMGSGCRPVGSAGRPRPPTGGREFDARTARIRKKKILLTHPTSKHIAELHTHGANVPCVRVGRALGVFLVFLKQNRRESPPADLFF